MIAKLWGAFVPWFNNVIVISPAFTVRVDGSKLYFSPFSIAFSVVADGAGVSTGVAVGVVAAAVAVAAGVEFDAHAAVNAATATVMTTNNLMGTDFTLAPS